MNEIRNIEEINRKLIKVVQNCQKYIYNIEKSLKEKYEMENYLQDAYSFIIPLIKKICTI